MQGPKRRIELFSLLAFVSLVWAPLLAQTTALQPFATKSVLLVMPSYTGRRALSMIMDGIQEQIAQQAGDRVSVTVDAVHPVVGDRPDLEEFELGWYRQEYANQHFDMIIVVGAPVYSFVTKLRKDLWRDVPLVFCGLDEASYEKEPRFPATTGIFGEYDWRGNVKLAKQLFPNTRHIALAGGATSFDRLLNGPLKAIVGEQNPEIEFIDLTAITFQEQIAKSAKLPPDTVLIVGSLFNDVAGHPNTPGPNGFRGLLTQAANSPVLLVDLLTYSVGGLGGSMAAFESVGREAAQLAMLVLTGFTSADSPPTHSRAFQTRVDWRQLRRWRIPESQVPPGVAIDFRPRSIWVEHREAALIGAAAIIAQSLLIIFLLGERRRRQLAQGQIAERLRFETLLSQITSSFAGLESTNLEQAILMCLKRVKDFFQADRASVWQAEEGAETFLRTHVWPVTAPSSNAGDASQGFDNTILRLSHGEEFYFSNAEERAGIEDVQAFTREGIQSFLAIPLRANQRVVGTLLMASSNKDTAWPKELISRLRTVADVLGTALARSRAEKGLRESEILKGSILDSIRSNVAVVDRDGVIIEVNQKWMEFAAQGGLHSQEHVGVGTNYLEVCQRARETSGEAQQAIDGIRSVLNGSTETFEFEYLCPSPEEQRWFRMTVDRLNRPQGGAVISHLNITERKRAEAEQTRSMEEIAHLDRVASMGHIAASLAHELAQPLAAILSNNQAAERFASLPNPDMAQIRRALAYTSEDTKRAGGVLQNIRSALKKQPIRVHDVDLNAIVESVARFSRDDMSLRGIQLRTHLTPGALRVRGDDVPLQQVILNLMNNGIDAMQQMQNNQKLLTIRTAVWPEKKTATVTVEDEGPGLPEEVRAKLFTPFFTTKKEGLGMGLSICRSIVESLGGVISVEERNCRGTAFRVELPLATVEAPSIS